jgi:multidrug efflux pump subunit AcrB
MAAVSGMMGPYMAPIPVLGSVAMMFSLFAAFVFTSTYQLQDCPY